MEQFLLGSAALLMSWGASFLAGLGHFLSRPPDALTFLFVLFLLERIMNRYFKILSGMFAITGGALDDLRDHVRQVANDIDDLKRRIEKR
jgi:hypothetical protein